MIPVFNLQTSGAGAFPFFSASLETKLTVRWMTRFPPSPRKGHTSFCAEVADREPDSTCVDECFSCRCGWIAHSGGYQFVTSGIMISCL
ncbi:hypothetical protein CEXT_592731 [Caerostris extrusa]|uniref:Uncharacterized protein n=1 Tax=Caerostris extrusa TaxID=172846 RepID=A0AAV4WMP0_CAEEX|nr:hypothetical protein CEXT_592731 [Caerostris extrusa]